MNIHRLNDQGIQAFKSFLESLGTDAPSRYPIALLTDEAFTEEVQESAQIEAQRFQRKYDAAQYLSSLLEASGFANIERDAGLWAWLALFFFEQLCPVGPSGKRRPGESARWFLNCSGRRYYRHLLAGPTLIYRQHKDRPERTLALLCSPLHQTADVYLEIADSPFLISNPTVVEVTTLLYYDAEKGRVKKGVARDNPGGARRLGEVLSQFDCTWDLHSMTPEELLAILPREFDKFKG